MSFLIYIRERHFSPGAVGASGQSWLRMGGDNYIECSYDQLAISARWGDSIGDALLVGSRAVMEGF